MTVGCFIHDALDGLGSYAKADTEHAAWLKAHGLVESPLDFRRHRNYERGYRFGTMIAVANLFGLLVSPWKPEPDDWFTLLSIALFSFVSPRAWALVGALLTRMDDDDVGPTARGAG
jgi:hypothetical protein